MIVISVTLTICCREVNFCSVFDSFVIISDRRTNPVDNVCYNSPESEVMLLTSQTKPQNIFHLH